MRYQAIILSLIFVILSREVKANNSDFKIKESFHTSLASTLGGNPSSIPVVFFISSNSAYDAVQIQQNLERINQIFNNSSTCSDYNFSSSIPIEFCLATRDIDKNPSEGIVFVGDQFSIFDTCEDEFDLKFSHRMMNDLYPTSSYLNIYLVDDICASCENYGCAAGGYATLPSTHGNIMDGIILEMDTWFGDCDDSKAIVHELGHYLGLYHTFEGGCKNDNCLEDGDKVCDTPPQFLELITNDHICLQGGSDNSCSTDVNSGDPSNPFTSDQNDLDNNIMNYIPLSCQESFTQGQIDRMVNMLSNERASLLDSEGCLPPCNQKISIQLDIPDFVYTNQEIAIINNSLNGTSFQWLVDGQQFDTQDLIYTFQQTGIFSVTVIGKNDEEGCTEEFSFDIIVSCFEQPIISSDSLLIEESDVVNLAVENSDPTVSYTWFAGDSIIGTGTNISYNSNFSGAFSIHVIGCKEDCCETSNILHLLGGSCPPDNDGDLWIFGRGGVVLNFENGNPVEEPNLFNGDFLNEFSTDEPSTIQLDQNGDLLFYSNADKVWNRNHEIMLNGNILGSASSCQMLSLRQPGSSNLYYIFSPEQMFQNISPTSLIIDSTRTINYSIIDMNLDGGLGAITVKDQPLLDFGPEKVSAIRHCNGKDWWVVTHPSGGSEFHSFLLSENGLSTIPVISQSGGIQPFQRGKFGAIKFSHDGKLIANSYSTKGALEQNELSEGNLDLFFFDNSTGTVSDLIFQDTTFFLAYGIEFSPDNSKLYVAQPSGSINAPALFQYDISVLEQQAIADSKYTFDTFGEQFGAIQLGKDGKIYSTYPIDTDPKDSLHVIQNPNGSREASNLTLESFPLEFGNSFLGLPNFPGRVYRQEYPEIEGIDSVNICTDSILTFHSFGRCIVEDYLWDLIGQNTLLQTTGDSVQISFHTKSIDTLLLTRTTACGMYTDSFPILVDDCNFQCDLTFDWVEIDTMICEGESPILHYSPISQDLSVNGILQNSNATRIDLGSLAQDTCLTFNIFENFACDSSFQICITVDDALSATFEDEIIVCRGTQTLIPLQTDADIIELINIETDSILFPVNGQLFSETVTDTLEYQLRLARFDGNCDSYFSLYVYPDLEVYEESRDTLVCFGDSIMVLDSLIFSNGIYEFELFTVEGCDSLLTLEVEYFDLPVIDTSYFEVCTLEEMDTMFIPNVSGDGCSYNDVSITVLLEIDTTFVQDIQCSSNAPLGDTVILNTIIGCDSVVITLYDYVIDSLNYLEQVDTFICPEVTIVVLDSTLSAEGIYDLTTSAVDGCDSIVRVNLQPFIVPMPDTAFFTTCNITEVDTNYNPVQTINGCAYNDVEITTYIPLDTTSVVELVCISELAVFDTVLLTTNEGCDSVIVINSIYDFDSTSFYEMVDTLVCPGTALSIEDSLVSSPGMYEFSIFSENGCDSIVAVNFDFFAVPTGDTIVNYTCNIFEIDTSYFSNMTANGCFYEDVVLTVFASSDTTFLTEIECEQEYENDTLFLNNLLGCDSVVITEFLFEEFNVNVEVEASYIEESMIDLAIENPINDVSYDWYLDSMLVCQDCLNFSFEAENDQILFVEGINLSECTSFFTSPILVEKSTKITFANIFSPNGDQINDRFFPIVSLEAGTSIRNLKIFDRWGNLVFSKNVIDLNDENLGWDGNYKGARCSEGIYVFQIEIQKVGQPTELLIGDVALIR